jgi:hypothetical protein
MYLIKFDYNFIDLYFYKQLIQDYKNYKNLDLFFQYLTNYLYNISMYRIFNEMCSTIVIINIIFIL